MDADTFVRNISYAMRFGECDVALHVGGIVVLPVARMQCVREDFRGHIGWHCRVSKALAWTGQQMTYSNARGARSDSYIAIAPGAARIRPLPRGRDIPSALLVCLERGFWRVSSRRQFISAEGRTWWLGSPGGQCREDADWSEAQRSLRWTTAQKQWRCPKLASK